MEKAQFSRNLLFILLANAMVASQISAAQASTDESSQKMTKKEYFLSKVANPESEVKSCTEWTDCATCTRHLGTTKNGVLVRCRWCPAVDLCSTGDDANRREWLSNQCHNEGYLTMPNQCPLKTKAEIKRDREYLYFCLVQSLIGWFFIFIAKSIQNHGVRHGTLLAAIILTIVSLLGYPIIFPGAVPGMMHQGLPLRFRGG